MLISPAMGTGAIPCYVYVRRWLQRGAGHAVELIIPVELPNMVAGATFGWAARGFAKRHARATSAESNSWPWWSALARSIGPERSS